MRRPSESELVTGAQPTIELGACSEVFAAKSAGCRRRGQRQRPAHAGGVAEFPGDVRQVFLADKILGDVPSLVIAGQDQLCFYLTQLLRAGLPVRRGEIIDRIVVNYLQECFVGAVDILKLHVQHGINPVVTGQGAKAVFPAEAREEGAVPPSALAIQVEFSGPPALRAVLKFSP